MLATFGHRSTTDRIMSGGDSAPLTIGPPRERNSEDSSGSHGNNALANGTGGSKSRSQSPGRDSPDGRLSPNTFSVSNNNTGLHDKVSTMWKEKYGSKMSSMNSPSSEPADSLDSNVDMDELNTDSSSVNLTSNGHSLQDRMSPESRAKYRQAGNGGLNNGLGDDLSRHHLGGLMRGDMVSCETSKLLRGILQGKDKRPPDGGELGDSGVHGSDSGLISQLLQREHSGRVLMRDTSYDGELDSVHSATPGDLSSDESDHETHGNMGNSLNGGDMDRQKSKDDASSTTGSIGDSLEAKRARIENIIGTMRVSPNRAPGEAAGAGVEKRHKRKSFVPQQHDVAGSETDEPLPKVRKTEREVLRKQLKQMQTQLQMMQDRYVQLFDDDEEPADQAEIAELNELNLCRKQTDSTSDSKDSNASAGTNIIHSIARLVGNDDKSKDSPKRPASSITMNLSESSDLDPSVFIRQAEQLVKEQEIAASKKCLPSSQEQNTNEREVLKDLAKVLKEEISHSVGSLVDTIVARFALNQKSKANSSKEHRFISDAVKEIQKLAKPSVTPPSHSTPHSNHHMMSSEDRHMKEQQQHQHHHHHPQQQQQHQQHLHNRDHQPTRSLSPVVIKPTRTKVTDKIMHPLLDAQAKMFGDMPRPPLFPPPPYYHAQLAHLPHLYGMQPPQKEPEQNEPMSLVVTPKKKRTKVTDTRLSPRAAKALLQEGMPGQSLSDADKLPPHHSPIPHHGGPHHPLSSHPHHPQLSPEAAAAAYAHATSLVPVTLPTSVAIPNPSLQHSDVLAMYTHGDRGGSFCENSRSSSHSPAIGDHGSPNMAHTPNDSLGLSMIKGEGENPYEHPGHRYSDSPSYDGSSMVSFYTQKYYYLCLMMISTIKRGNPPPRLRHSGNEIFLCACLILFL